MKGASKFFCQVCYKFYEFFIQSFEKYIAPSMISADIVVPRGKSINRSVPVLYFGIKGIIILVVHLHDVTRALG